MNRIIPMPLYLSLLLSLALHAMLVLSPNWLARQQRPPTPAGMEARLLPPPAPAAVAEAVNTEAATDTAPPRPRDPPRSLSGVSLRRAQSALSEHLYYPPQAVALGLEGDVILLLNLSDTGQLLSASIARSSGHAILDQAALDAARRIGALPGNPRQTLFPVNFRLQ
jgi:protein TonB